jgi:hypothetical protein
MPGDAVSDSIRSNLHLLAAGAVAMAPLLAVSLALALFLIPGGS